MGMTGLHSRVSIFIFKNCFCLIFIAELQAVTTICQQQNTDVLVQAGPWCLQCFDAVGWAAGRASGL